QLDTGAGELADGAGQVADGTRELDRVVGSAQQRIEELGVTPEDVERTSEDLVTAIDALEELSSQLPDRLADPVTAAVTVSDSAESLEDTASVLFGSAPTLDKD